MVDIERAAHRTEVIVDEGINTVSYALDESLIYFGAALEDQDFEHAAEVSGSRRYFFFGRGVRMSSFQRPDWRTRTLSTLRR